MKSKIFSLIYKLVHRFNPGSSRFFFIGVAFFGLMWYAIYTNFIIERLDNYSHATTDTYADLISEALFDKMGSFAEYIVLEQIVHDFDMPIIVTDMLGRPQIWKNISVGHFFWKKRLEYDDNSFYTRQLLTNKMRDLKKEYSPKLIYGRDKTTKMGFLYYGDSSFLNGISFMPYFEIAFIIFLALAVYLVVRSILVTEKGNLWVGLAKETAHQLGTPLTSLMGWVEYLKMESRSALDDELGFGVDEEFPKKVEDIMADMEKDISRLTKVTNRFSLIGSLPALQTGSIETLLDEHITYFSKRLPTLGKKIEFIYKSDDLPPVKINYDLLSWVFENLFKNSLDAMDEPTGSITIKAKYISVDRVIRITHRDTGNGISRENRKLVFSPGHTSKKRGWGLGLSLAKRIVEEYHQGKIYISWSQKNKGSEFTVELPVLDESEYLIP